MQSDLNLSLFYTLNHLTGRSVIADSIFAFCANLFGIVLIIALVVYYLFFARKGFRVRLYDLLFIFGSSTIAWGITWILKQITAIPRPFTSLHDTILLLSPGTDYSFPSGHATFYMALGTAVFLKNRTLGYWYIAGALVIGICRVIVGAHWPLDVLVGFCVGILVPYVIFRITHLSFFKI